MTYKDYKGFTKTYVVVHNTGFGVMEAPYEEKEVVFETDSLVIALEESSKLKKANNSEEDLKTSWIPNTYWVNVNTLSKEGKELEIKFGLEFEERLSELKKHSDYVCTEIGEYKFHSRKSPFDEIRPITGKPMESSTFVILDFNDNKTIRIIRSKRILLWKRILKLLSNK